ncbi:hypothetical protein [Peptostreptococcus sp. D1]|uniref:hypothetical protein n=1 Tax=Peptostreptococcus sp. D1 TaxID=72304 RepID=UPI0008E9E50D|nr:hypothetical protein [Peptostreptococcus sp. D1]SFE91945.1 hypothetical protein SAMN02910278_02062 [Peptostreptococcus sp. D1]
MARTSNKTREEMNNETDVTENNILEADEKALDVIKLVALENIKSGVNYYFPGDIFDSTKEEANYLIEVGAATYIDKE